MSSIQFSLWSLHPTSSLARLDKDPGIYKGPRSKTKNGSQILFPNCSDDVLSCRLLDRFTF